MEIGTLFLINKESAPLFFCLAQRHQQADYFNKKPPTTSFYKINFNN